MIDLPALAASLPDTNLGVAVSGGGDSAALLRLLAVDLGRKVLVVTVDHGLRAESGAEAQAVADLCAAWEIPHQILKLSLDNGPNLQARARDARYKAMADWAKTQGISTIALGHTATDVAETFLIRLARGSGVDGLAVMRAEFHRHRVDWVRPLLDQTRDDLRAYLTDTNTPWIDDPSNDDDQFDRIKMRKALPMLADLGLTQTRLTQTAQAMTRARTALEDATQKSFHDCATTLLGCIAFDCAAFDALPMDLRLRLAARVVEWIGGEGHPPRLAPLQDMLGEKGGTLAGVQSLRKNGKLWMFREYNAVAHSCAEASEIWDGRWSFTGAFPRDAKTQVLGHAGLKQVTADLSQLPHPARLSLPAVWLNGEVLAGPDVATTLKPPFHCPIGH